MVSPNTPRVYTFAAAFSSLVVLAPGVALLIGDVTGYNPPIRFGRGATFPLFGSYLQAMYFLPLVVPGASSFAALAWIQLERIRNGRTFLPPAFLLMACGATIAFIVHNHMAIRGMRGPYGYLFVIAIAVFTVLPLLANFLLLRGRVTSSGQKRIVEILFVSAGVFCFVAPYKLSGLVPWAIDPGQRIVYVGILLYIVMCIEMAVLLMAFWPFWKARRMSKWALVAHILGIVVGMLLLTVSIALGGFRWPG